MNLTNEEEKEKEEVRLDKVREDKEKKYASMNAE